MLENVPPKQDTATCSGKPPKSEPGARAVPLGVRPLSTAGLGGAAAICGCEHPTSRRRISQMLILDESQAVASGLTRDGETVAQPESIHFLLRSTSDSSACLGLSPSRSCRDQGCASSDHDIDSEMADTKENLPSRVVTGQPLEALSRALQEISATGTPPEGLCADVVVDTDLDFASEALAILQEERIRSNIGGWYEFAVHEDDSEF